ncbi:MAG: ACT domain-containing protein [Clostridiales bacterium]|nr:ACT domain-containing protein [Clostridiales bacterium]
MELKVLDMDLSVCKVSSVDDIDQGADFFFVGKTDEEISLVCETSHVPSSVLVRDDGWKGFRIVGELDFSLIGILSRISSVLADNKIGIFAVSTYNTDYILVRGSDLERALNALASSGYEIVR